GRLFLPPPQVRGSPISKRFQSSSAAREGGGAAAGGACPLHWPPFHHRRVAMVRIGTPLSPHATRVLLLGSGELGKEVAIELQRLGAEVIAADRYADAPAMQVAHRSHVLDMLDTFALRELIAQEKP